MEDLHATWTPRLRSILRIMAGLLLLQYGLAKIVGFPAVPQFADVAVFSLSWFAGALELVFGALVALGLLTRFSAFILSGEMAFAYFIGHAAKSFYPILNGGGFAALFCFVFLYIAAAGGGPWSLDRLIDQRRGT